MQSSSSTTRKRSMTDDTKDVAAPAAAATTIVVSPSPSSSASASSSFVDMKALPSNLLKTFVILFIGAIQGTLLGLAGMFSPYTFRSQMTFETFILMKVFVSGVGSSMVIQSLLFDKSLLLGLGEEHWNLSRSYRRVSMGYLRVVLGCLLIGAGMAISGSGPTMVGVQLGMQTGASIVIFIGFLFGAAVYHGIEKTLFHFPDVCWKGDDEKTVLEDYLNDGALAVTKEGKWNTSDKLHGVIVERSSSNGRVVAVKNAKTGKKLWTYSDLALPMGIALLLGAALLEYCFPHAKDLERVGLGRFVKADTASTSTSFSPMAYVLPSFAGGFIGINQISTRFITHDGQGGSRSLINIVATLTNGVVGKRFKVSSFPQAFQFFHVYGGTFIGGIVALVLMSQWVSANNVSLDGSNTNNTSSSLSPFFSFASVTHLIGFSPFATFIGAAICSFGARFAGGCTCGHGVSGASELCVQSLVGAACIFGGGILCAVMLGLETPSLI